MPTLPAIALPVSLFSLLLLGPRTPGHDGQDGQDGEIDQAGLEALTEGIKAEVEAIRETEFLRPVRVAVANEEELIAYARARMEKSTTREEQAASEMVAKLLGTIPAEMDLTAVTEDLLEAQVGGFYDPDEDAFYLMSRFGGDMARVILSHELTHALDDQLYDIDGTLETIEDNGDRQFAYHAVVEGSGSAVMTVWTMRNMANLDLKEMMKAAEMSSQGLDDVPPYLWKPLIGVYVRGQAFLNRTDNVLASSMKQPALEDYHTAFTNPPSSSEQILHPEKYWDPDSRDEPVSVRFEDAPDAPVPSGGGWERLHADTLGEVGWGLVLEDPESRAGMTAQATFAKFTSDATEGWGGDRVMLLGRDRARVLHCTTVWDTPEDAAEFRTALISIRGHLEGSMKTLAATIDSEQSGVAILPETSPLQVDLRTWFGASVADAEAALAGTNVRIGER